MMNLRISILDSHTMFSQALTYFIDAEVENTSVVCQCRDAAQLFGSLAEDRVDIVILELNIADRDGIEVIKDLKRTVQNPKILVVSAYKDPKFVRKAMISGADAFLHKGNSLQEVGKAISEVADDKTYMGSSVRVSPRQQANLPVSPNRADAYALRQRLTKRELEILENIAMGKNNKQIGTDLFISYQTVGVHRKNIMKKLGVKNTLNLVKLVYDKELV